MIDLEAVGAVVSQYERFGWKLERIILETPLDNISTAFPEIPTQIGTQDALWFSRESGGRRAWELRRLSGTPFALVRVIESDATDGERDRILENAEAEMSDREVKPDGEISNGKY